MLTRWAASLSSTRAPGGARTPASSGDEAERLGIETHVLGPDEDPGGGRAARPRTGRSAGAGGDGSLAAVAERRDRARRGRSSSFRSARFNHFARDLGLDRDDPESRRCGPSPGASRRIDVGARERPALPEQRLARALRAARPRAGRRRSVRAAEGARAPPATSERPGRDGRRRPTSTPGSSSSRTTATARRLLARRARAARRRRAPPLRRARLAPEHLGGAVAARRSRSTPGRVGCARRSTASPSSSRRRCGSRSSRRALRVLLPEQRLAPLACAGTRGRRARSRPARTSGARRRRRAARACPRRYAPSSRS